MNVGRFSITVFYHIYSYDIIVLMPNETETILDSKPEDGLSPETPSQSNNNTHTEAVSNSTQPSVEIWKTPQDPESLLKDLMFLPQDSDQYEQTLGTIARWYNRNRAFQNDQDVPVLLEKYLDSSYIRNFALTRNQVIKDDFSHLVRAIGSNTIDLESISSRKLFNRMRDLSVKATNIREVSLQQEPQLTKQEQEAKGIADSLKDLSADEFAQLTNQGGKALKERANAIEEQKRIDRLIKMNDEDFTEYVKAKIAGDPELQKTVYLVNQSEKTNTPPVIVTPVVQGVEVVSLATTTETNKPSRLLQSFPEITDGTQQRGLQIAIDYLQRQPGFDEDNLPGSIMNVFGLEQDNPNSYNTFIKRLDTLDFVVKNSTTDTQSDFDAQQELIVARAFLSVEAMQAVVLMNVPPSKRLTRRIITRLGVERKNMIGVNIYENIYKRSTMLTSPNKNLDQAVNEYSQQHLGG